MSRKADPAASILRGISTRPDIHEIVQKAILKSWPAQQLMATLGSTGLTASKVNIVVDRFKRYIGVRSVMQKRYRTRNRKVSQNQILSMYRDLSGELHQVGSQLARSKTLARNIKIGAKDPTLKKTGADVFKLLTESKEALDKARVRLFEYRRDVIGR